MTSNQHLRTRDRLKGLFRKSREPSPNPASGSTTVVVPTPTPPPSIGERFFVAALAALSKDEQELIKKYIAPDVEGISAALTQSYDAALDKKRICEDKRWQWTFRGKNVVLRDEAEKVVNCLNMLKPVGDAIASLDEAHIGLPWAGISALLKLLTADFTQMATLLTGMAMALSMANRLQAYFRYFQQLPTDVATTALEEDLVKFYIHVLQFLAAAIRVYGRNSMVRTFEALWQPSTLETFQSTCDTLGNRTEISASNCDRLLTAQDRDHARQSKEKLDQKLSKLNAMQGVKESVETLQVKFDLEGLKTVKGVTFDSHKDEHSARCLAGTRVDLLQQVTAWADDPDGRCIFWLCGKAGTGKSTIARTAAFNLCESKHLGASFFFKRGEGDRGTASRFFPTIVRQLIDKVPSAGKAVAAALDANSSLCEKSLTQQFEELLQEPFSTTGTQHSPYRSLVVVIDALDECERSNDIRTILRLLSRASTVKALRLRVLVTSRPELPIQIGFRQIDGSLHEDVMLEEVQATTIDQDIRLYLDHQFNEIREDASRWDQKSYPLGWPGYDVVQSLVNLARPLFIFAFTVCRFVKEGDHIDRLHMILDQGQNRSLQGIEKVYLPILQRMLLDDAPIKSAIADFQSIVGAIVLLVEPLTVDSLSSLLKMSKIQIGHTLDKLHSLLSISTSAPIRLLHLSFRDFLIDANPTETGEFQAREFHIDELQRHNTLALQCIRLLASPGALKQDICGTRDPGVRRAEIDSQQVKDGIPSDVAYACSYWALHTIQSKMQLSDGDEIHQFLERHFLYWLEALSWLGRLSSAITYITQLRSLVRVTQVQISAFLDDCLRFARMNRHVADLAPLQLYNSALIFAPTNSRVRKNFQYAIPKTFTLLPKVGSEWSAELLRLEGHNAIVNSVAVSPDGKILASASCDKTMRIWDAATGDERHKLWHDDAVNSVAFSPSGKLLASASDDMTVRIWDVSTGDERQKLIRSSHRWNTVVFLSDSMLASGSSGGMVQIWDTTTAKGIRRLQHDGEINSIAVSPNGTLLAFTSTLGTMILWDLTTGKERRTLPEHADAVCSMAFSPEGDLASGSEDGTIRVRDIATGEQKLELRGHESSVYAVAFSPNGRLLAWGHYDTVRLWDMATGEEEQELRGHSGLVTCLAFVPDGRLATASFDRTVRVWDVTAHQKRQKLDEHAEAVEALVFSPDGALVASGEKAGVRLWNAAVGEERYRLEVDGGPVKLWAFSLDSELLALVTYGGTIIVWDVATARARARCTINSSLPGFALIAFTPDLKLVAWSTGVRKKLDRDVIQVLNVATGEEKQAISTVGVIQTLGFSADGKFLLTNRGTLEVETHLCGTSQLANPLNKNSTPPTALNLSEEWIQYQGRDILWLPYEYRGWCSAKYGGTLVIGQRSGAVSFLRIEE